MVLDVIALVVACVAALMGGGRLLSLAQFKRQVEREDRVENRENRTDIFSSYREQIELAEKDGLTALWKRSRILGKNSETSYRVGVINRTLSL